MVGTVEVVNAERGMVALRTEEGYSIFELLGGEVEVGDKVSWRRSTPLGGETVLNLTTGQPLDVCFENHHVARTALRAQLLS